MKWPPGHRRAVPRPARGDRSSSGIRLPPSWSSATRIRPRPGSDPTRHGLQVWQQRKNKRGRDCQCPQVPADPGQASAALCRGGGSPALHVPPPSSWARASRGADPVTPQVFLACGPRPAPGLSLSERPCRPQWTQQGAPEPGHRFRTSGHVRGLPPGPPRLCSGTGAWMTFSCA